MNITKPGNTAVIDPDEVSASTPDSGKDPLIAFIKRRHPTYELNVKHWTFLESCYQGGREWFDTNIFQYIKEGPTEFASRVERAYRFNHSREVVDLVNKYLFKQTIVRNEGAPEALKEFWKSASKNGRDINDLMRQASQRSSVQGRIAVVIDSNVQAPLTNLAEQKKVGAKIFAYVVRTEQLLDYAWDETGELSWVKIMEVARDDADPVNSSGIEKVQYRLWTKNDWKLFEVVKQGRRKPKVVMVNSGEHNLGLVPVVMIDNTLSDRPYDSPALIDDIAYLDRATANYLSNLDAIIQDQTFSQLTMPAQGLVAGEDGASKVVEMGTKRIFLYDGQGGNKPEYISPDVKQAELIVTLIGKIINEIYHTVGLAGERTKQDNAMGIDNSSGVAKAYDFEKVNALLSSKAHSLENAENRIAKVVAAWASETITDDLVSYPDNFDTRGLYDEFDLAGRLMLVDAPDSVRREQFKAVVDKLFPQIKEELKKKMLKDIEAWPPKELLTEPGGDPASFKKPGFQGAKGAED